MLTDAHCRNAICPPDRKQARFTDAGGLYLQVSPSGSKRWFYKYRTDGKEKQLALGSYPAVGLTAARKARDVAKLQRAEGSDPIEARKLEKLKGGIDRGDSFQAVALDWHGKQVAGWNAELETVGARPVPLAGSAPLAGIEPMELVFVLQKVEERGALETADRALMLARQIWRYGLPTVSNNQCDITEGLKSRLTPYHAKNFAAIVEPQRFDELLGAMHAYKGGRTPCWWLPCCASAPATCA